MLRRIGLVSLAVAALVGVLCAQGPAPGQQPAMTPQGTPSNTAPEAPSAQVPPASAPAQPPGPQPKTREEYDAYLAVTKQIEANPTAAGTALHNFEANFPQSELRVPLYIQLMRRFQLENNAEKTLELGRKVTQLEPNNVLALLTVANVIAERPPQATDADRDQRLNEGLRDAQSAVALIDKGAFPPPGVNITAEQVETAKAVGYLAMGTIELHLKNDSAAEEQLRRSIELSVSRPDPLAYLRLSLALDHQKKYAQALTAANQSLEYSANEPQIAALAKQEQTRLNQLSAGVGGPQTAPEPPKATKPQENPPKP